MDTKKEIEPAKRAGIFDTLEHVAESVRSKAAKIAYNTPRAKLYAYAAVCAFVMIIGTYLLLPSGPRLRPRNMDAARSALKEVKKVQARTEVGVNFIKYSEVAGDMWVEVKPYLDSADGRYECEFNSRLRSACEYYREANIEWSKSIREGDGSTIPAQTLWLLASAQIEKAEKALGD